MGSGKLSKLKPVEANSEKIQGYSPYFENQTTGDKKQGHSVLMTAFSNELIWKTLGYCLSVTDLKSCRLVNQKFNRMVMDGTKFKDRVNLNMQGWKLMPEEFGKTEENWKNVGLNFPVENALDLSEYEWLYPLLTDVEFLSLRLHGEAPSYCKTDFHPLLGRLLASCKKLKSLALEPDFILMGSGSICEGMETLEKLEELEILQPDFPAVNQLPEPEEQRRMIPVFYEKLTNVKVYKTYSSQFRIMNLASFPVQFESRRPWLEPFFLFASSDTIVSRNRCHLRSHSFYNVSTTSVDEMVASGFRDFQTPALKALKADWSNLDGPHGIVSFIKYLNFRPLLEQLDITCYYNGPEDSLLLSALICSVARHRSKLKKLKLETRLGNLSDWSFLGQSGLQDLHLEDCRKEEVENEWIRQVMCNLPESIKKLYLNGALLQREQMQPIYQMQPLKRQDLARLDPDLLTHVSIFNAGGLVDNKVAKFICNNFKLLRKLNLSHAQTDDEGFRNIAGLKGLQRLTLKVCGITNVTLKQIRFLELRYLNVTGNPKTTASGITMSVRQCPSLETLVISSCELNFTMQDGLKICPKLKALLNSDEDFPQNE